MGILGFIIPFLIVLTIIVFVHEWGHYAAARRVGVRVETFSIGFGPEIFGWNDRHGTRWKFSAIPLGGYVKFYGDADAASRPDHDAANAMSPAERHQSLLAKPVGQRAQVAAAGPVANFIFAILVFAGLFMTVGQPYTPSVVGAVMPNSPAQAAGLVPGDRILAVDGARIQRFEELRAAISLSAETEIRLDIERAGQPISLTLVPQRVSRPDLMGGTVRVGQIGIQPQGELEFIRYNPAMAVWQAGREVGLIIDSSLTYVGRFIMGRESGEQLSGPIGIARVSGVVAESGLVSLIALMASLSVAIGLINLFPVPMLDGGHLLYYAVEAIRGKPLSPQAQDLGFRIGLGLVLCLFLFVTWNDLSRIPLLQSLFGSPS